MGHSLLGVPSVSLMMNSTAAVPSPAARFVWLGEGEDVMPVRTGKEGALGQRPHEGHDLRQGDSGRALVWAGSGAVQTCSMWGRKSHSPPTGRLTVSTGISRSWGDAQVEGFRLGSCKSPAHHPEAPEAWLVGDSWYLGQLDGAVHG